MVCGGRQGRERERAAPPLPSPQRAIAGSLRNSWSMAPPINPLNARAVKPQRVHPPAETIVADLIQPAWKRAPRLAQAGKPVAAGHHVNLLPGHRSSGANPILAHPPACTCGFPPCPSGAALPKPKNSESFPKKGAQSVRILPAPAAQPRKKVRREGGEILPEDAGPASAPLVNSFIQPTARRGR